MMNVGMRTFYPIGVFHGCHLVRCRSMRRLLTLAVPAALALVPAAQAAVVQTDRRCYLQDGQRSPSIRIEGTGFPASQPYTVSLDGKPLQGGMGTMSDTGAMTGTLTAPPLGTDVPEQPFTVGVESQGVAASAVFTVTRLLADFSPAVGNPRTLKVRFSVHGFALRDETATTGDPSPEVFLHYIRPDGRLRHTVRLGTATGTCGTIARTKKRRLFPFGAERGTWQLQFDTRRSFTRGRATSDFLFYSLSVRVKKV
jgi:hypothetical protein